MAPTEFDPFTRQTGEIPYAEMARLRRLHRVVATPSFPYLTRYEDCRRVLVDNATFANVGGMRAPGVVVAQEELMINEMDPPQHTRIRKLEQTTLNQAGFKQARSFIDELARRLVGEIPRSTVVDLVPALTAPVPGMVAAHIIGVPVEDFLRFRAWSEEVLRSSWVELNRTERGEGLKGGYPEFAKYLDEIVTARRANPQDDLITRMVETEVDGQRLTDTEMRIAIAHLIIAGNETTTNLLGNLFFRLFESEALYARIRNDRSLIPALVEESLRYDAPVQLLVRTFTRDVEFGEFSLAAGERVTVGMACANRDEDVYGEDAEEFRVDRENPAPHLTFGIGHHLCLGTGLARMEGEVVTNALLDAFSRAKLAEGFEYRATPSFWELGPTSLDVVLSEPTFKSCE